VTIGTANGLSLSTQVLSLGLASAGVTGALSGTDWSTFNSKQNALTNPVTGTGDTNTLPKFTGSTTIGNSLFTDNGTHGAFGGANYTSGTDVRSFNISAPLYAGLGFWANNQYAADIFGYGVSGNIIVAADPSNIFSDSRVILAIDGTQRFAVFSNGNVTIANSPTDAGFKLDVSGTGRFTSNLTAVSFIRSGGTSAQFLKADGSVDSTTYVPVGRTITINGSTQDLSADRTFNVGTVTSVTASTPLFSSGGATPNITIQQASGSQNGFLSSTDWTTFNNKQNALTNPVTGTGTTTYLPKFTGSTTIANSNIRDDGTDVVIDSKTSVILSSQAIKILPNVSGIVNRIETTGTLPLAIITSGSSITLAAGGVTPQFTVASTGAATFSSSVAAKSNITVSNNGAENPILSVVSAFADGYRATLRLNNTHTGGKSWEVYSTNDADGVYGGGKLAFVNTTNSVNAMTITSDGAVLAGATSSPSSSVSGVALQNPRTLGPSIFSSGNVSDNRTFIQFINANGVVGSISTSGSVTTYNVTSDYRLKEDLQEIKGLEKVQAIKVYDYKWKSDDSRMHGVLAHELADVLPYAVHGEKDGIEMQGVDYSKIVPVLIKAIQELNDKIK
jgi:hypothetical protein